MISILVPNYNNARYLPERFDTILAQTFSEFEVIVCDSYSTDGAWEIICGYAKRDSRIRAYQVPKQGVYAGWNECVKRARGSYVYMATSDDTMAPDCLHRLIQMLEHHPDCGLAMCGLEIIDMDGNPVQSDHNWRSFPAAKFYMSTFDKRHIRRAPLDGVLAATLHCVWHSATQILVRSSVYERHGVYRTDLGSIADYEWNTRVAMHENVVYIPDVLATLRVHEGSASVQRGGYSVIDMQAKRNILSIVLSDLEQKRNDLVTLLRKSGWMDAFLFQEAVYNFREKRFWAFSDLHRLLRLSSCDVRLALKVAVASFRGKESVRRAFTHMLLSKTGMSLDKYITYL